MKLSRATAIAAFLATAQAFTISNGPRYVEIGMTPITLLSLLLSITHENHVILSVCRHNNNNNINALSTRQPLKKKNNNNNFKYDVLILLFFVVENYKKVSLYSLIVRHFNSPVP
jgi:hypothetical protein